MYLKFAFIFSALLLAFMIIFYKLIVKKQKSSDKTASYLSVLTWAFALYILTALILAIFIQGGVNKAVVLFFALSPFIIGNFATYEKENMYSIFQILCAIISAGYIFLS